MLYPEFSKILNENLCPDEINLMFIANLGDFDAFHKCAKNNYLTACQDKDKQSQRAAISQFLRDLLCIFETAANKGIDLTEGKRNRLRSISADVCSVFRAFHNDYPEISYHTSLLLPYLSGAGRIEEPCRAFRTTYPKAFAKLCTHFGDAERIAKIDSSSSMAAIPKPAAAPAKLEEAFRVRSLPLSLRGPIEVTAESKLPLVTLPPAPATAEGPKVSVSSGAAFYGKPISTMPTPEVAPAEIKLTSGM